MKVKIVEVGPRDGLQNESKKLSTATRIKLVKELSASGLNNIEIGAFVSPKWVPQMADTAKVVQAVQNIKKSQFSVLVPNKMGMELALKSKINEVAVFGACSETFSQKNINCSIADSFKRFKQVVGLAKKNKVKVRGYLSTAFGCPYEGKVSQAKVIKLVQQMLALGVYEVSIGDTIGVATPKQVNSLLLGLSKKVNLKKIAMHFHDTRGTALANVYASLQRGVRVFDSSIGSLGGCPYAKGASGNLATEDLVYMLEGMGVSTQVDINRLIKIKKWIEAKVGRDLPSHVGRSGMPNKPTF